MYICIYICIFVLYIHYTYFLLFLSSLNNMIIIPVGLVGRQVFANGPEDIGSIPGQVIPKTLKMVLDTSLLNT